MSVVDINERTRGRRGERDATGSSYERVLVVRTDDINDGPEEVIQMVELAGYNIGTGYPTNAGAVLFSIKPVPRSAFVWDVDLAYETQNAGQIIEDPTDRDPVIRWSFAQYNKIITQAYDTRPNNGAWPGGPYVQGQPTVPISASSRKKFSPDPTQQDSNLLCDITLWRNTFTPSTARAFVNTLNDVPITVAGLDILTWEARLRNYGATKKFKSSGSAYYEYNYQIEVQLETWVRAFLDQSFYKLINLGLDQVLILDTKKQKLKKPALLDGTGQVLGDGADPIYIEFLTYYPADWSTLNLPTSG